MLSLGACVGESESSASPSASTVVASPSAESTATPRGSSSPTPRQSPSSAPSHVPSATPVAGTEYTVRAGDSLAAIARAYGTTTAQLQAWNAGRHPSLATTPNIIEPGWVLIVSGDPE